MKWIHVEPARVLSFSPAKVTLVVALVAFAGPKLYEALW